MGKIIYYSTRVSLMFIYGGFKAMRRVPSRFLSNFEKLRRPNGAFIAAPHPHYEACWTRDQLYCSLGYFYTEDMEKFKEGVWVVFNMFHKHRPKMLSVIAVTNTQSVSEKILTKGLHAKVHPDTLEEITHEWGHHQLDAIGLFLYIVGFAYRKGIDVYRDEKDREILACIVEYLRAVRYWEFPDYGMWEENLTLHASSIGAVVAGLTLISEHKVADVPFDLILKGQKTLEWLLPNESPDRDIDMAQLSLIWPYNVVTPAIREIILDRAYRKLVQERGLNRYYGDNYYRSDNGISGEWPMGFFWLSIIASGIGEEKKRCKDVEGALEWQRSARYWFDRGLQTALPNMDIPEIYQNGKPNEHTPLAWAHAMALIAEKKLKE